MREFEERKRRALDSYGAPARATRINETQRLRAWPKPRTIIIVVGTVAFATILWGVGMFHEFLQFWTSKVRQHSRPIGSGDMTFDVALARPNCVQCGRGRRARPFLLQLDGLKVSRVAQTSDYESCPSVSMDGKHLAYAAGVPGDRADHIFTRPVAGGPSQQLTRVDANDLSPRFSPDGTMIVFARNKTYGWGGLAANWQGSVICLVGSEGTNERQITPDEQYASEPRFSADGRSVIFSMASGLGSVPIEGSKTPEQIPFPRGAVPPPIDAGRLR